MASGGINESYFAAMEAPEVLRIHLGRGTEGPLMTASTVDACLALLATSDLTIVDLDGPPPELHPRFRDIVILVRALRRRLVHRCNLAVAAHPGQSELPELLADHRVDVVVSLPGAAPLDPATSSLMRALRRFNAVGYGVPGTGLILDLVVPSPTLDETGPHDSSRVWDFSIAASLESWGVGFSGLHVVSHVARPGGNLVSELQKLAGAVHPARVLDVPCRSMLTVDWDGALSEEGGVPLGRNVCQVRSLDDVYAPAPPLPMAADLAGA